MIGFKDKEIERQFMPSSGLIDDRLAGRVLRLDQYCQEKWGKSHIVSHICRTKQEQIQLYPGDFVGGRGRSSYHQLRPACAIDLRTHIIHQVKPDLKFDLYWTDKEIETMQNFYERCLNDERDWMAFIWHRQFEEYKGKIVRFPHIHLQIKPFIVRIT